MSKTNPTCPRCGKPLDPNKLNAIDRKTGEKIHIFCKPNVEDRED